MERAWVSGLLAIGLLALCGASACLPRSDVLLPGDPNSNSRIVLSASPNRPLEAVGLTGGAGPAHVGAREGQLLVLEYDLTLSQMALSEGPLPLISEPPDRPLLLPQRAFLESVENGEPTGWQPIEPDALSTLAVYTAARIADPTPQACIEEGGCYPDPESKSCVTPCPEPDAPAVVSAARAPMFEPCPPAWHLVEASGFRSPIRWCEPLSATDSSSCSPGRGLFAGVGCAPLSACADRFAPAPSGRTPSYVAEGALAGDGSLAAPFASVDEALQAGAELILLAPGHYSAPATMPSVTLIGACAERSFIDDPMRIQGGELELEGLTLLAQLKATRARVQLQAVTLAARSDHVLEADSSTITGARVVLSGNGSPLLYSRVELEEVTLYGNSYWVLDAQHSTVSLSDVFLLASDVSEGLRAFNSRLTLQRALLEDVRGSALNVDTSSATVSDVVIRRVRRSDAGLSYGLRLVAAIVHGERLVVMDVGAQSHSQYLANIKVDKVARITLADTLLLASEEAGQVSRGLLVYSGSVAADRLAVTGFTTAGVEAQEDKHAHLLLSDLIAAHTRMGPSVMGGETAGHGLLVHQDSYLQLVRAELDDNAGAGVAVQASLLPVREPFPLTIELEDVTALGNEQDGARFTAAVLARITRARFEDSGSNGLLVEFGQIEVEDLVIDGVYANPGASRCRGSHTCAGTGLAFTGVAQLTARRFRIRDSQEQGVFLLGNSNTLSLEQGVIERGASPFGAGLRFQLEEGSYDLRPLLRGVSFRGYPPEHAVHAESVCKSCP